MLESHFLAQPIAGGFTWTLPSRLGEMLHELEALFGPRDPSYTILGIEFKAGGPQIWFPGNRRHVVVQLGAACQDDGPRSLFQLSHEAVHLLDPKGESAASVLEEGIAAWYSQVYTSRVLGAPFAIGNANYEAALELARSTVEPDPSPIRALRSSYGDLSKLSADQLRGVIVTLDRRQSELLVQPYSAWAHGA